MSNMTLPGFSAEAALYKSSGSYRAIGGSLGLSASRSVLPQLPIGFCMADCDYTHSDPFLRDVCKLGCLGGGTGGPGGGPSSPPELVCGPCIRGRQRCGIPGLGFQSVPCFEE